MNRKASLYIKDMIDAIVKIEEFIKGMCLEDFTMTKPQVQLLER